MGLAFKGLADPHSAAWPGLGFKIHGVQASGAVRRLHKQGHLSWSLKGSNGFPAGKNMVCAGHDVVWVCDDEIRGET